MSIASGLGWHKPHPHRSETMRIRPNIEILHRKNASGKRHKVKGYNGRTYGNRFLIAKGQYTRYFLHRYADSFEAFATSRPIRHPQPDTASVSQTLGGPLQMGLPTRRKKSRHDTSRGVSRLLSVCFSSDRTVSIRRTGCATLPCILESSVDRVCAVRLPLL